MKKISLFLAILTLFLFSLCGCKSENPLYNCVSELRETIYIGNSDSLTLKAGYGFKESPYVNDKKVSERIYQLDFRLLNKETENITYYLTFEFNNQTYNSTFKLDPIKDTVCTAVEIENFTLKEFTVTISHGGERHDITLKSVVPENTISYKSALDHLYNEQKPLINTFMDENGKINAEIYVRLIIKDEKSYWYIGIASGKEKTKALLIDGFSGEVLAIREIF